MCKPEDLGLHLSKSGLHALDWNHGVVEGKDGRIMGLLATRLAQHLGKDLVSKE